MPEQLTAAEADVLHFMLRSRAARAHAITRLTAADFASTVGSRLFVAIHDVHGRGGVVDPSTVALEAGGTTATTMPLWDRSPHRTDIECVNVLLADSTRRHLKVALERISGRITDAPIDYFRDALAEARMLLPSADQHVEVPNIAEFLASVDTRYEWLMPWMVERGERLMIVAPEGSGKTVLLRQWAFQLAAGCHWVTNRIVDPCRVLYVDAENSDRNIARASRHLYRLARRYADGGNAHGWDDDRLRIKSVWNLDITASREQRDTIEGWLERYRPDLLIIGPIYKVGRNTRSLSYEDAALAVTDVIDGWRQRFGIAVAMEHHAPGSTEGGERQLNPFGSTVWRRWPDVGVGLKYEVGEEDGIHRFKVRPFRGYRGSHLFPPEFHRSDYRADTWPWIAFGHSPQAYDRATDHQSY